MNKDFFILCNRIFAFYFILTSLVCELHILNYVFLGSPGTWIFRTSLDSVELTDDSPEYKCFMWGLKQELEKVTVSDAILPSCPCTYIQGTLEIVMIPLYVPSFVRSKL